MGDGTKKYYERIGERRKKGMLFTFEGTEGCGKTTQRDLLGNYFESKDQKFVKLREPGGVDISENIRKVLLDPETKSEMSKITELLLFSAARSQFVSERVAPLLERGKIILLDRYYDSTTAYQGYGNGTDLSMIYSMHQIATKGIKPDLTFLLDIPVEKGLKKTLKNEFGKLDRIERKSMSYHEKVRQGYLEIAKREPERVKVIQYIDGGPEEMHKEIVKYVEKTL